jgi:putative hydrolase of the HAD superfamily
LSYIKQLKGKYEIVLHSDNFEIISEELKKNPKLTSIFDQMIFSNDIGYNKTQRAAFKFTLNKINKEPNECIFTDDKEKNLVAAEELGIHTILYTSLADFQNKLENYLSTQNI